jgi:hypothetical protein
MNEDELEKIERYSVVVVHVQVYKQVIEYRLSERPRMFFVFCVLEFVCEYRYK